MPQDRFDCCSSFMKCSDAWACIHADDPLLVNCTYRKKLEAGICFYGKNTNIFEPLKYGRLPEGFVPFQKPQAKTDSKTELYLTCYKMPFAILTRSSNTWSYKLDSENIKLITDEFTARTIPFRTSLDFFEQLPGDDVEIEGPCNSRVVFKIGDREFHILSFNGYLIQNWYAEKINKSLLAKDFESRVELVGSYIHSKSQVNSITKSLIDSKPPKNDSVSHNIPVQLTLFDLSEVTTSSYRRS